MTRPRHRFSSGLAFLFVVANTWSSMAAEPQKVEAEVVVYGATAGGFAAAVAVAREGKKVVIVEPGKHVGGMVSGGLGATDFGNRSAIGGISREFFRRVLAHYTETYGPSSPQVKDSSDGFLFEPHVAEAIFRKMLEEAKVEVVYDSLLEEVVKDGARIVAIKTSHGHEFAGPMFIDASYEGDLMARAGVKYVIGREGVDQYGESIAGVQKHSPAHQWPVPVPALGFDGKPLPCIQPNQPGAPGSGDAKTQAYNYRLCMTDRKENQVPFPRPEGYDPARYELLFRYIARKPNLKVGQLMNPVRVPNGKTDTNNNGPFSTDHIGGNWDFPNADPATREKIRLDHIAYVQGFLYFLANDPRVPQPLHNEMATWGLAKDEFLDTDQWPHQLYVRESRRMLGPYFMTQNDIMEDRKKDDSVGLGSYNTDSHHVQRIVQDDGNVLNEGDFQVRVRPYAIPYRSLIPKPAECSNLLVPVCMSASHVAYGTIRMEPVYMILGHASGVAASLAIDQKVPVQALQVENLKAKLLEQNSILDPDKLPVSKRVVSGALDPSKMAGVVIDDSGASKEGDWSPSASSTPFVGEGYLHEGGKADGKARIRYTPKLAKAGKYEVRVYFTPHQNRATNTPVTIHGAESEQTVRIDQRKPTKDNAPIVLGVFPFDEGTAGWVEIRNDATDGFVIADAVQFVPVP
jgi:FAD dependent oxidoreductase